MSAVLRAYGADFDVDRFLAGSQLRPCAVFHRGEPVLRKTKPDGRKRDTSGMNVNVSEAGFDEFPQQVTDAIAFLQEHRDTIRDLMAFPGVEGAYLDFGIARRDVVVQTDTFPGELIRLAGALGLGIMVSQYPPLDAP